MTSNLALWKFKKDTGKPIPGYLAANAVCDDLLDEEDWVQKPLPITSTSPEAYLIEGRGRLRLDTGDIGPIRERHSIGFYCFDTTYGECKLLSGEAPDPDDVCLAGQFYLSCPKGRGITGHFWGSFWLHRPQIVYPSFNPKTHEPQDIALVQPTCFSSYTMTKIQLHGEGYICIDIDYKWYKKYVEMGQPYRIMAWTMAEGIFDRRMTLPVFVPGMYITVKKFMNNRDYEQNIVRGNDTSGLIVPFEKMKRKRNYQACAHPSPLVDAILYIGVELLGKKDWW